MASIYAHRKDCKIVSFKLKAYVGKDEHGKQLLKCSTWVPSKNTVESRLLAQADKKQQSGNVR